MSLEAMLDATVDDDVRLTLRVENTDDSPVELTFTSGKTADVVVYEKGATEDGDPVWRWSDGRMFTQALQEQTLQAGETVRQTFTWENAPPGEYVARGTLAADPRPEAEAVFSV